jgi:ABC-type transport system substrate-binding protein
MKALIDSIKSLEVVDRNTFIITTKYPDPILLNKLALFPMAPNMPLEKLEENPVGTGPYKIYNISKENLALVQFEEYYGKLPKYKKVILRTIVDRDQRVQYANKSETVALVYPIASSSIDDLDQSAMMIAKTRNLEVNFFLYNLNRGVLKSTVTRNLLLGSLRDSDIETLTDALGVPANQYVAGGVFGFNSDIKILKYPKEDLKTAIVNKGLSGLEFKVALPANNYVFKEYLAQYWYELRLRPQIDLLTVEEFMSPEKLAEYDIIFLGWKSDYGDSSQFIESVARTGAEFNWGGYSNSKVDRLLAETEKEMLIEVRQLKLGAIMKILTLDDPIGIPLFESEILYAVNNNFEYTPRVDAFIDINKLIPRR